MARRTTAPPEPRWAGLMAAAEYANMSHRTLRHWVERGIVPAYRLGPRLIQLDLNDIDALRQRIPTARNAPERDGAA